MNKGKMTDCVKEYLYLADTKAYIKEKIKEEINGLQVSNRAAWKFSKVEKFETKNISDYDLTFIRIDERKCTVTCSVDVETECTVSGPSRDYIYKEGFACPFRPIEYIGTQTNTFTFELYFQYDFENGKPKNIKMIGPHIPGLSQGIAVYIEGEQKYQ